MEIKMKYDEIDYSIGKLKSLLNKGYGVKVIATGGGMADSKEFGDDVQKADYVKKAKEKNKIDIIINNAKDELKYAIEPKSKNKGRKLVIVITEEPLNEDNLWYHGTPDVRGVEQTGSFVPKTDTTTYVSDPKKWNELQAAMQTVRSQSGTNDEYFKLLDQAAELRKSMTYKKPIYFTKNRAVASTYADPKRAFDYQGSKPRILQVKIDDSGKILEVPAHGQRVRMINADFVKAALRDSGISEEEINKYFDMFPNAVTNNRMSAETIGIITQLLGFDIVDVLGVLDSYHGGSIKSTVRMVFDPSRIRDLPRGKPYQLANCEIRSCKPNDL
jgi:hypothetical protein